MFYKIIVHIFLNWIFPNSTFLPILFICFFEHSFTDKVDSTLPYDDTNDIIQITNCLYLLFF